MVMFNIVNINYSYTSNPYLSQTKKYKLQHLLSQVQDQNSSCHSQKTQQNQQ